MSRYRHLCLPYLFLAIHTAFVLVVWMLVHAPGGDPETGMVWILFNWIDWPASCLVFGMNADHAKFVIALLAVGGTWWLAIGFVVQLAFWVLSNPSRAALSGAGRDAAR
jgi:hypothetical protein